MAMQPQRYIEVMSHWHKLFLAGANLTVMGVTDDQLRSIKAPTIVIPGNDKTHNSQSGRGAQSLIPNSKLHQLPIEDQDVPLIPFEERGARRGRNRKGLYRLHAQCDGQQSAAGRFTPVLPQ